jgi:hypothetical protein
MKCLSLKQPYAELIISGQKTIELRTWNTKFRGKFLVHASKNLDKEACVRLKINPDSLITGAIIGKATLYGIKEYHNLESFVQDKGKHHSNAKLEGIVYGFLVKNAQKFTRPIAKKGQLRFFDVEWEE